MKKADYEALQQYIHGGVKASSLRSDKDRTLMIGVGRVEGHTVCHHIYLEAGLIHSLLFDVKQNELIYHYYGEEIPSDKMYGHPSERRGLAYHPELCDKAFCMEFYSHIGLIEFLPWANLSHKGPYVSKRAHEMNLPLL